MKKIIFSIFSTLLIFPLHVYSNESFSVEIEALTLIMKEYKNNKLGINKAKLLSPTYMAHKQDEYDAKVEVTEKIGLQIINMHSFHINICKKKLTEL